MQNRDITRLDIVKGATVLRQGHFDTLAFTPRNSEGEVVDLSGKVINVKIIGQKGIVYETSGGFNVTDSTLQFSISENIGHGEMWMEITVTDPADATYRQKFPTSEYEGKLFFIRSSDDLDYVGFSGKTVAQFEAAQTEFTNKMQQDFDVAVAAVTQDSEVALARMGEASLRAFNQKTTEKLADKASKEELQQISLSYKESYDTLALLQTAYPTGDVYNHTVKADGMIYTYAQDSWKSTGIQANGTGIADGTVTGAKIADDGLEYIYRKNTMPILEEQQKGVLSKLVGITNGIYNLSSAHADSATLSYVDNLTSPVKRALKNVKVSHTNATDLYRSFFVFFPVTVTETSKPYANGYWIKKDFFSTMTDEIFSPIVWFYNASTLIENISFNITDKTLIKPGYKNSVTKNGITFNFAITKEFGEWFFIEQRVNVLAANTNKLEFGLFVQKSKPQATTTLEISNFSVLENQTYALPQLDYIKETSADSRKTVNFGYNFDKPLGLLKWRSALAKRQSAIARVAVIGDSISEGYWSGLNHERAYPVLMRKALQAKYGGQDEGFVTVNDVERFVTSGTWVNGSGGVASRRKTSVVAGSKITFTFSGVAVDVIYSKNTDGGTCAVKIDGVDKTAINCNGTSEVYAQTQSYTGLATGAHTLEIFAPTDGTKVYVEGAYVKTVGDTAGVQVERRAKSGGYTGDWTSQLMLNTFTTKPADLFIIALGINDLGSTQTIANFKSRMQTIITAAKAVGSVVIVPMMQPDPVADTRFVNWKDWVQVYYDLADENSIPLIDIYKAYGEAYQPAQSFGLFGIQNGNGEGTDTTHPSARGQMLIADVNVKLIG